MYLFISLKRVGSKLKFEVVNDKNITVMSTTSSTCIPNESQINSMLNAGYKIRVNNKIIAKKKLNEFIKEVKK